MNFRDMKAVLSVVPVLAVIATSGCSDSKFGSATGVRKTNVELSRDALPSVSPGPIAQGVPFDVLEGGVAVSKVGINMDDRGGGVDYNDTAYCFAFKGKILGTQVVSDANQTVKITRTNHSDLDHEMELRILDSSKNLRESVRDFSEKESSGRNEKHFTISMKRGDFIEVVWHVSGLERGMADAYYFEVRPNVCKNTGT